MKWFKNYHGNENARRRLFLFPFAGGSASSFHSLSLRFSEFFDVRVAQYPGRHDRMNDKLCDTIEEIAAGSFAAIDWSDPRPVYLFGHSMGALVSFEVVRAAERAGHSVRHLVVSAASPPHLISTLPKHPTESAEIIEHLRELEGTPSGILEDPEMLEIMLPVVRADYSAVDRYSNSMFATVEADLLAVGGRDDEGVPAHHLPLWQTHSAGNFETRTFPGGHFYLNAQEDELVRLVVDSLAGAHSAGVDS